MPGVEASVLIVARCIPESATVGVSIRLVQWVLDNSTATGHSRMVLVGLANHADDDGCNAWPSVATLARYCRVSERTIQRALKQLEADGLILVERQSGGSNGIQPRWRPNRYIVVKRGDNVTPRIENGVTDQAKRGDTALSPELSLEPPDIDRDDGLGNAVLDLEESKARLKAIRQTRFP